MTPIPPPSGLEICKALIAASFLVPESRTDNLHYVNMCRRNEAEAAERYKAAAAKIREDRARRKAENFAKRNKARGGSALVGAVAVVAVLVAGALVGFAGCLAMFGEDEAKIKAGIISNPAIPARSVPAMDVEYRRMDDAAYPVTSFIITDPKTKHRWLLVRSGVGASQCMTMTPLADGDFQ